MLNLVKTLHSEFALRLEGLSEQIVPRTVSLPEFEGKVSVAIGMRRTGKTYLLFQQIKHLLSKGIPLSRILYVDFEDDRIQPLGKKELGQLLDAFYSLYPKNHQEHCYLFLDEIQTVDGWPLVLRRYLNSKDANIYLSGSSAKLLSKEIATSMRGRSLSVEVWPYSYHEYLLSNQVALPGKVQAKEEQDTYAKWLLKYIESGGLPEAANAPSNKWRQLLQDYVNIVTYRDIIERHHITNTLLVKRMISFLLKNTSTNFSINKYFNDLKSQGIQVGRATLYDYLDYIEDAYLAFTVPVYDESIRKVQNNPKKIYAVDTGLSRANQLSLTPNFGRLFENLIYLDLRRRGDEVYYYLTKKRYEVDFLTLSNDGKMNLYQVAWDISTKETKERELRALEHAQEELNVEGMLITPANYLEWLGTAK